MQNNKNKIAISAAKLYYQSGYSQTEIAKELSLSRPSVSRILQYAKDMGFVRIEIFDPIEDQSLLAKKIISAFGLKDACIANAPIEDEEDIKKYIGQVGAEYLSKIVQDGDIIGVGWGTTMHCLSHALLPHPLRGAQIVQLEGGHYPGRRRNLRQRNPRALRQKLRNHRPVPAPARTVRFQNRKRYGL